MLSKFIVYACPTGELGKQLEAYFETTRRVCGVNTAHKYVPHCTLTNFFDDESTAIPIYIQALDNAYHRTITKRPLPAIAIMDVQFQPEWHGFELESPWIRQLIADFIKTAYSPTRQGALRLKEWLHLSLAYDFQPKHYSNLVKIAEELVNPKASVNWELRFYERHTDWTWTCHQSWQLD